MINRVSVSQLVPGMITAEDIFSFNDQLLIAKDTELTATGITLLEMYDIYSVRIKADDSEDTDTPPYLERVKQSEDFKAFKEGHTQEIQNLKHSLYQAFTQKTDVDTNELLSGTFSLVDNLQTSFGIFDMLHCVRELDDSTYAHSVNVALICNVAAKWLGMSDEDVRTATACGLFHDVGKMRIPKSILSKPDALTDDEYDIVKKHPLAGYKLLKESHMDDHICNAALMHHERCDGSGYPRGINGSQIDKFAKLVAIADVYDAATAARVYRGPLCPFTIIRMFEQEGLQKYEPEYIMTFLENIVNTYIQNRCRLSNGMEGDIIYINKKQLSRPIVQCGSECIDLMEHPELTIECLL